MSLKDSSTIVFFTFHTRCEANFHRLLRDVPRGEDGQAGGDADRDGQQPSEDSNLRGDQEVGRRGCRASERRGEDVRHLHARGQVPGAERDGSGGLQKRFVIDCFLIPSHFCAQGNIPSSWPPRSLPGGSTSTTFVMSSTSRCRRKLKNTSTGERCLTLYISLITPFPSRQDWSDWPCRQHWESH